MIKKSTLLLLIVLIHSCGQDELSDPIDEKSSESNLLKIELEHNETTYTTSINGLTVTLLKTLPYGAEEVRIKTIEISDKAISSKKQGDLLQVGESPISIDITAESGAVQKEYTINLTTEIENSFTTNDHLILYNQSPLEIKGVVYTPNYPGNLPWDIENSVLSTAYENSILNDVSNIKEMGANTIRLWDPPVYTYQAIKQTRGLFLLQTIWINTEESNFQSTGFKEGTKAYIKKIIDRIYSVYRDNNPPLIAYIVGNELSGSSIISTNDANPDITSYSGNYITATNVNATEAFIAEMADYVKTYEFETYKNSSLVTYANYIGTYDIIDVPFLDFRCDNAYSYAPAYYRPGTPLGSNSGTVFQGWVEQVKSKHPNMPLLISETGLSVSPGADRLGPPDYGYGGNSEKEQADGILQNFNDLNTAAFPTAGVCIHEYLDSWWKSGQADDQLTDQPEEWFGLVKFTREGDWYITEPREAYTRIKSFWEQ